MGRIILDPPAGETRRVGWAQAGWWHDDPEQGRIVCDLCPRECHLKPGDRGFCFVRQNIDQQMVLTTYGRSTGFCIDPIEKKPLNHFYPGTSVLSFGTAGCNLGCKFCQNWDISKSREVERLSAVAMPDAIVAAAQAHACRSVAFTYNDPIVWAEYAIDTARACRDARIATVAVTAGYISPAARGAFFQYMDAANVDLKGFTEDFYYKITYSHLQPVLETIEWLQRETSVWVELTNLVIPQTNDSPDDLRRMCDWILQHCGPDIPVHFSAFHPDFRMRDLPPTPHSTLLEAHSLARQAGLRYVYVGNVDDVERQSTYCANCGQLLIERNWYELGRYHLQHHRCTHCQAVLPGRFADQPGDWGRRRQPVDMSRYSTTSPTTASMLPVRDFSQPLVDSTQEQAIFRAASATVVSQITQRRTPPTDPELAGAASLSVMGAFVTLKRDGRLRACCGTLGAPMKLADAVRSAALRTATEDARLPPISPSELPFLTLEVNLLYGFRPVPGRGRQRMNAVEVGRHGLQIRRGGDAGLLLPSVPVEQGWDAETFLRHVCRKAGLPTTAWEADDVELVCFESREFGAPLVEAQVLPAQLEARPSVSDDDFARLEQHARDTLLALISGAAPNYYVYGVADGTVAGVLVELSSPQLAAPLSVARWSLRPGVPLQATLFSVCEALAQTLRRSGSRARDALRSDPQLSGLHLTILTDPSMQGTLPAPDLRGHSPSRRALLLVDQGRVALRYAPDETAEEQVERLTGQLLVLEASQASLFGLLVQTSAAHLEFSTAPAAVVDESVRKPAVAGAFYPADAAELSQLVDRLLSTPPPARQTWPVAMVPHAGLVYSGKIAAAALQQLEFPETIVILGPKHTADGVEWAVAPHAAWEIPGARVAGNLELARELAAQIPGLRLDAAAHRREHAIEVELPLLARLAPRSRIVAIALGGGDWRRCQELAEGLARVLDAVSPRPLVLISSDMNHFATDSENRRLDEIALQAMETLDPERLLWTVREHQISMCGVIPAVVAMQMLRRWGGLVECRRTGYATSADATGDLRRVVGYAGMLLR
ncbi:MAG: AmmeMemoRadiSam system radical SAM enzyme [Pirellulales bacterium]